MTLNTVTATDARVHFGELLQRIVQNDEAVMVATKAKADSPSGKMLADAMKGGITVIVCQNCMKHYKVAETDLVGGVKLGTPDLTQGALFAPNTRTLSW